MAASQNKGTSGKKNTSNGKTTKKTTASKAAQKNARTAKGAAPAGNKQVGAVVLFAVALFLLFLAFINGGNVWAVLQGAFFGLFGVMAYIIPFLLIVVAVLISMDKDSVSLRPKVLLAALLIWFLCSAIYVFAGDGAPAGFGSAVAGAYKLGSEGLSGGAIGALLGAPLLMMFGYKLPAGLTLILLAFVTLMLLTGTTLVRLYHMIVEPAEKARTGSISRSRRSGSTGSGRSASGSLP